MRLIYYYNVSLTLYTRVSESVFGWISSFSQTIINNSKHRKGTSCVFISEEVLYSVWCICMALTLQSILNDSPSRFGEYFCDSALLHENCSSKKCLEMWKRLVIADSVISLDQHFAQLVHGRENRDFQWFWLNGNENAFRVINIDWCRY